MKLTITINGSEHQLEAEGHIRLLDLLREEVGLTGTKEGCGEGECGACTVLINGEVANSCLVAAGQVDGATITTVEGLANESQLDEIQRALVEYGGAQCGICTPGVAVCARWALDREPDASADRIRELLAGNICRCTGYQAIVDAVVSLQNKRLR